MTRPRPSDAEVQILSVLWERGPLTVRELREAMPDGKGRAYTTVLSLVQIMEKKGLVGHTAQGRRTFIIRWSSGSRCCVR